MEKEWKDSMTLNGWNCLLLGVMSFFLNNFDTLGVWFSTALKPA